MKHAVRVALAAALLLAQTVQAAPVDEAEVEALRDQIEALSERLRALEAQAATPSAAVAVAAADAPAPQQPLPTADPALEWARKISLKGDLRYRHEEIDVEGAPDNVSRQRLRARLAVAGRVTDDLDAVLGLASGGSDPRSTNQTLTNANSTKDLGLDLAYFDWRAFAGSHVLGGKMKYPTWRPGSLFIDGDINPEGLAFSYAATSGFFANARGFWITERSLDDDSMQYGFQAGWRGDFDSGLSLTAALSYDDFVEVQGRQPFFTVSGLSSAFGNSLDPDGNLLYDFNVVEGAIELAMDVAGRPLLLYAQLAQNTEADDFDTAYHAGFTWGKAANPGSWELGYSYARIEKDALFGQLIDSDFGGGVTDSRGHLLKAGYAITKNWTANLTVFINEINVDVGTRRDYDRLQLDLNFKY